MAWSTPVRSRFQRVPSNPSEADFHGPYNKLLHSAFPLHTTNFTVVPQVERSSADVKVTFAVLLPDHIVFILELKPPSHLAFPSTREVAERQIRDRLKDVGSSRSLHCTHLGQLTVLDYTDFPLPTLHTISAMGTRLSFYTKEADARGCLLQLFIQTLRT
ncbi:hypothetical protein EDC04DRAFT_2666926 [Pisolithus marmoratus]|nr:hypothetical protein EDC04DRAFT_2666926 [Pisolithus marmoratus]